MNVGTFAHETSVSVQHIDPMFAILSNTMPNDLVREMAQHGLHPVGEPQMMKELAAFFDDGTGEVCHFYRVTCVCNYAMENQ